MAYREDIMQMLFKAYFDARKHKRNKHSQLEFELNLEDNIFALYSEIVGKTYKPGTSICFVVDKPVKREIFAANFRDRVVHHFIFNILNPLVEKVLLHDVYSCRKGKGTLFGVKRATSNMQSVSCNFTQNAYVLKMDISGYFMNINKEKLYNKVLSIVDKNELNLPIQSSLLKYLIYHNIFHNPTLDCKFQSHKNKWQGLPQNKSLFYSVNNCGLPIGNLTSQLYGNLYLNDFDHFIKRELKIQQYARYVDDFYIMHIDKLVLLKHIETIKQRLQNVDGLLLHPKKIYLQPLNKGFLFLGIYILPYRRYVGKRIKAGLYNSMNALINSNLLGKEIENNMERIQSYMSMLMHHTCYKLTKQTNGLLSYVQSKYNYQTN